MSENLFKDEYATVKEVKEDSVIIEIQRNEGCQSCGMSSVCGTDKKKVITHEVSTDYKLEVGDVVEVALESKVKLLSSFVIFVIPVLVMIAFYLVPKFLFKLSENVSVLISVLSLLPSAGIIKLVNNGMSGSIEFNIIRKVEK